MPVKAVFFDVGETLVNEERYWRELAVLLGLEPHVVWAALGATIALGEGHKRIYAHLGVDKPDAVDLVVYRREDLYPDALLCLERLRRDGYFLGIAGNQTGPLERWARDEGLPVDTVASSASWGVEKPARAFFERVVEEAGCEPSEVAYVGDRVDNDIVPALEAGLVAVHIRRGPWGYLQRGAERAHLRLDSLSPSCRLSWPAWPLDKLEASRAAENRLAQKRPEASTPPRMFPDYPGHTPWVGGGWWVGDRGAPQPAASESPR